MKHHHGLIAHPTFQCVHPDTGNTGDWLYTGGSHRIKGTSVSPVFADHAGLCQWARDNGWKAYGDGYAYEPQVS